MIYEDFADEQTRRRLLKEAGYNPDLAPRGGSGPPGEFTGWYSPGGTQAVERCLRRNWVCVLSGYLIDGHSDPDNTGGCIHCYQDLP